ncbi:Synaptotagmin-5 [Zea mays]|uniref:Synaptotagmin-5 n=1 Tax=Zea mays TaxID=4577 RepID=A0A1D6F2D2_MAIZE|nr:Synaptotagmin-5 [Zea mays]
MAFLFGAFLGLVVGVAVVMAFARFENSRAEQRRELAATAAAFSKLTVQDLRKLIPPEFYPSWVSFTQKQKLKWLNQELTKIWPFVNEAASELIKTSVEPIFEQYKSFILASLHFSKLTLGTVAPQFTGMASLQNSRIIIFLFDLCPFQYSWCLFFVCTMIQIIFLVISFIFQLFFELLICMENVMYQSLWNCKGRPQFSSHSGSLDLMEATQWLCF